MRMRQWGWAAVTAGLLILGPWRVPDVHAQSAEELKQRIEQLERSTREQVESLKRMIKQQEAERAQERKVQEDRERSYEVLKEQLDRQRYSLEKQEQRVAKFLDGWENFFDLQAGSKQGNESRDPLGKDIRGNVFTSDQFKVKLGGSLRLHVQRNDTPVGESVNSALVPDKITPPPTGDFARGFNNAHRDAFRAFASRTRLNLALQGPETLGGKTSGFFEMDFNQNAIAAGETNSTNSNPRLRHAFGRWTFPDVMAKGNELELTLGQTNSFADNFADTVDFNTSLGGLGAALRRNPRVEIVDRYPLTSNIKFLTSIGFERPLFDNQSLGGTDLGGGALSGFPAVSGGIGLEAGRLGVGGFGIGSTQLYARTTWGEFEDIALSTRSQRHFTNQVDHGTFILDRIGFNPTGRALTFRLKGGGVWSRGEGRITNSEFDRRLVLDENGKLTEAESVGGWINPSFFLTDTISIRWNGGLQQALESDRRVVTGSGLAGAAFSPTSATGSFFREKNRQSEVSLWWTPGPFTFALSYNHTKTDFRRVIGIGSQRLENENNKIEFISWWSF